ncbi:GH92 family glycosyl hydrolase [Mucilaginibacter sp. UR6-11]|uniref:GH92 family glycosyl hydrolase n=1 Tax=Mucilaginibacter sp. UR6-11 TaxID=1435644 RepID=UPI001E4BF0F7|nr:GH92 family glycosyl hydrolase [Mucilaginibacter sp. UR6-11]MCC8426526.1 GH92 family glycosyl hydrolase [Mucilaginibacter sp. UR6-11]
MKLKFTFLAFFAVCATTFAQHKTGNKAIATGKSPADYVNLYIGSINPKTRSTSPVIKVPGGNMAIFPAFTPEMEDLYLADKIYGFPLGFGSLMINKGELKLGAKANASKFDHDLETATPYYYQALLEDPNINTEYTMTDNTAIFRFTIPAGQATNVLLSLQGNANVEIKNDKVIQGSTTGGGRRGANEEKRYFYAELSKPGSSSGTWENDAQSATKSKSGRGIGTYLSLASAGQVQTVELKAGISSISVDDAKATIDKEIGKSTFGQIKNKAKDRWNTELGLIKVKGGTERQRAIFYSTLYRTRALRMGNVWDTYRSAYALQDLIKPEESIKAIKNFVKVYEQTGWLPSSGAMIGNHSTSVIVEAYFKGLRGFDVEKAYAGMRKNAMEATMIPWRDAGHTTELEQCYYDKGFYPALPIRADADEKQPVDMYNRLPYQVRWTPTLEVKEWVPEVDSWHRRQSVSVTLEHCYDDWCLAQIAQALGKTDDYKLFMKRAHNYQNLYKPSIGLMAPKTADGNWVEPFDPKYSGGFAGEGYFAECNSWVYTWSVQHDIQGLINLMGSRQAFVDKLDELFSTGHSMDKLAFLGQFPDMTGLVGMYPQGNEPAYHIPYLYNYAGQPWKTQSRLRQLMDLWYDVTPQGLAGDEDGGATSSWYVFNAMGFYPQCPGRPVFDIGSPLFQETTINVGGGKTFVIEAKNVSGANKYIQSATLNGVAWNKPWMNNSDIVRGGRLVLVMGSRPNKSWGSAPGDAAPSMSVATVN